MAKLSEELLELAERLVGTDPYKPARINLRQAVRASYYALFHAICEMNVEVVQGADKAQRGDTATEQTYRAAEHGRIRTACTKVDERDMGFPESIQNFAKLFLSLQEYRHIADYSPPLTKHNFRKEDVQAWVESTEEAVESLQNEALKHKRAFVALILFPNRT